MGVGKGEVSGGAYGHAGRRTEEDISAFHGRVKDIRDVVSFEGSSVEELKREFQVSIDDYLAMCAEEIDRGSPICYISEQYGLDTRP